jgi:hypothetical protein
MRTEVTVTATFDTEAKANATVFGGGSDLGATSTPGADLDQTAFAVVVLAEAAFRLDAFMRFARNPAPTSCFHFLVASRLLQSRDPSEAHMTHRHVQKPCSLYLDSAKF